jgi:hypothetical protein
MCLRGAEERAPQSVSGSLFAMVERGISRAMASFRDFPRSVHTTFVLAALACLASACESGGVGDPCIPEEEYSDLHNGFALEETYVQSRSYECETRLCLVNHFQGKVSCPYGTNGPDQTAGVMQTVMHSDQCELPGFGGPAKVAVKPQRTARRPEQAVYCSCRCGGTDPNARYCECPAGFECAKDLIPAGTMTPDQLEGSYCIRSGTAVTNTNDVPAGVCNPDANNCGDRTTTTSG